MLKQLISKIGLQKRLVVLLGAGASTPLIPGTTAITDWLCHWTRYRKPTSARQNWQNVMNDVDGQTNYGSAPYFEDLRTALAPLYQNDPSKFLHFERLIHASLQIDHFSDYVVNQGSEYLKSPMGAFLEFQANRQEFDNEIHAHISEQACIAILDYLSGSINGLAEDQLNNHPLNCFFKSTVGAFKGLSLFSLNYDVLPVYSGLKLETGFHYESDAAEGFFNSKRLIDYDWEDIFCQLHGSCLFGYPLEGDMRTEEMLVRHLNLNNAIESRATTATDSPHNPDGSSSTGRLMITGLRKADALMREPFATYYHLLQRDFFRSPRWLIVGYGGGDTHVNQIIRRATHYWKSKGVVPKIAWIGYASDDCFEDGKSDFRCDKIREANADSLIAVFPNNFRAMLQDARTQGLYWIKRNEIQFPKHSKNSPKEVEALLSFRGTMDTFQNHSSQILDFLLA